MMQNSVNQPHESDQGNSNISSMGDSAAITIEFLRARLLTERSVSKAAKQRSDELAKRVLELEEQLKLVSLQRKKAEKAANNVLSILESRGVSEFLEEFDSGSELDETLSKSKTNNNLSKEEESSVCSKTLHDDSDGSENVASPLSGRSLSWKSGRASSSSREKSIDSSTRKQGTSNYRTFVPSSSRRRAGKSCRQIQRKEIRSAVDDSQINGNMPCLEGDRAANSLEVFPLNGEIESDNYREELENQDLQVSPGILQGQKNAHEGSYQNGHESSKGMEKALKYQAQFIGQYENEEKAQREWEEKFRENENNITNSGETGFHSDVSEEKDETKENNTSKIQEANSQVENSCLASELTPGQSNCLHPVLTVNIEMKESGKSQNVVIPDKSLVSEFSGRQDNQNNKYLNSSSDTSKPAFPSGLPEPHAIVPHATTSELGSVLGALNQAKLSLQHKFNALSPSNQMNLRRRPFETRSQIPTVGGLFRVPSELEYGMRTNAISLDSRPRLTNYHHDTAGYDPFVYRKLNLNASTGGYSYPMAAENRSNVETTEFTRPLARISPNNEMQYQLFHSNNNNNTMAGGERFSQSSSSTTENNDYRYPAFPLNTSYIGGVSSMYYPPNSH
ncbi:uncharacterized protein LOC124910725 [Impatiens glandulifera]|uniref:uncharacterized protein LOC124910725 n=1 Tax=Impatiens glandulifera TaxID=253017 RepID=UPI001FB185EF|nr:uncharacterized protein LOC124910725 [Impatiens glandulifera]XP_047307360.1 uncharacterized protein LOC124910725 [Impatiens glandulifera]